MLSTVLCGATVACLVGAAWASALDPTPAPARTCALPPPAVAALTVVTLGVAYLSFTSWNDSRTEAADRARFDSSSFRPSRCTGNSAWPCCCVLLTQPPRQQRFAVGLVLVLHPGAGFCTKLWHHFQASPAPHPPTPTPTPHPNHPNKHAPLVPPCSNGSAPAKKAKAAAASKPEEYKGFGKK